MELTESSSNKLIPFKEIQTPYNYIDIWLRFDTHFGHMETDEKFYNEYIEWLKITPNAYDIWGGDQAELAIPTHNKYKFMISQKYNPEIQWDHLIEGLEDKPEKHIAFTPGNHEIGRIFKTNPILYHRDPLESVCKENDIIYSRINTYIQLKVNDVDYVFYLSHGRTGARTEDYILKELINKGIGDQGDFVVVGHTHHVLPSREYYRNEIKESRIGGVRRLTVSPRTVVGIRPGSFLINPEYVAVDRPRPTPDGNVILRLYADHKDYRVFRNLRQWNADGGR